MTDLFVREAKSSLATRQSPPDSRIEFPDPGSGARRWQVFLAGIDQLPPGQREVFHLAWFVGLQTRVVSRLIGRSPRSAKQLWSEARGFVRDFTARASSPEATDPATTGHAA